MDDESRKNHGEGILEESWRRNLGGGIMEEEPWKRNHGGIMERESWRRNRGRGIMEEEPWRRNRGGGIMEEESWPGRPRRHPGGQRRLRGKSCQNQRVFLSKVARPTILAESGEGDPHDLRSLRTKVGVNSRGGSQRPAPGPSPDRQNPYS